MKKRITLLLLGLMTIAPVFSQTTRSKGESQLRGGTSPFGDSWETFTVQEGTGDAAVRKTYNYFLGNDSVDNLTVGKLLGHHWKGRNYSEVIKDTLYFVNVKTGEYLQIGDFWGENSITSHVGIPYHIVPGTSTRKPGVLSGMENGYWLQPLDVREERVVGRAAATDGAPGSFDATGYLYLRSQKEYVGDDVNLPHPGGFLFQFSETTTKNNELAYVIYTHRKSYENYSDAAEFGGTDSYYLLRSEKESVSDLNVVRARRFAGDYYAAPVTATISDGSDNISADDATAQSTNAHKYGTYSNASGGNTFTTNAASGVEGVTLTANGNYLKARYYDYGHVLEFVPPTDDDDTYTLTINAPSGYVITSFRIEARSSNGGRQFNLKSPKNTCEWIYGDFGRASFTEAVDDQQSVTLTIGVDEMYASPADYTIGLDFKVINVTLKEVGSPTSLEAGLNTAKNGDGSDLWKIVTKRQRDGYRIVASENSPVDVSGRIFNPKYNTSYVYNLLKEQCNNDGTYWHPKDGYEAENGANANPEYGWDWYERNQQTHPILRHVHPWDLDETTDNYSIGKEFHKVGTGRFWRYSERNADNTAYIGGRDQNRNEAYTTFGADANYCGSIYKGTANLQQTISGLKAGNYIVYVRAFFAPHNMELYKRENGTLKFDGSAMSGAASTEWKKQALIRVEDDGTPVWRRSHDSYLFAWSTPDYDASATDEANAAGLREVRRMLPSIYEGATPIGQLTTMSKDAFVAPGGGYEYTSLNGASEDVKNLVRDDHVFAFYDGSFFGYNSGTTYAVPRIVSGAGRFFNSGEHPTANNYRIGLPVVVGDDGVLTIGVDHTHATSNVQYVNPSTNETQTVQSGDHEWVCFDEWELLYLGADEPEEFVIDEENGQRDIEPRKFVNGYTGKPFSAADKNDLNYESYASRYTDYMDSNGDAKLSSEITGARTIQNNTQFLDLFDRESDINADQNEGKGSKVVKNVIIRRTMLTKQWNYIVLPVPLTRRQVEEGFGDSVKVSRLNTVQGKTLVYDSLTYTADKNGAYMEAGVPYIIWPSKNPHFSKDEVYPRWRYSDKVSNTLEGVAGYFFKGNHYMRNYEVEDTLKGPLYIIQDVEIFAREVFGNWGTESGKIDGHLLSYYDGSSDERTWWKSRFTGTQQWKSTSGCNANVTIRGYSGTYTLKEKAFYENPGEVPANSYYVNKGGWRYTSKKFDTTKGLMAYIQLIDNSTNEALARSFLDGSFFFEPVEDPEITGIEHVDNSVPDTKNDHSLEIYDLMGRKVTNPRPGTIYIMNGVKVMWK